MPRQRYDAFLLRHWHLPSGTERVEVRHITSGTTALVASLPAALDWIARREWPVDPAGMPADRAEADEDAGRE